MDITELTHTRTGRSLLVLIPMLLVGAVILLRAVVLSGGAKAFKPHPAERAARRATGRFLAYVRKRLPTARANHLGALDIHPRHFAVWIITDTDAERDALLADATLDADFRRALAEADYPVEGRDGAGFTAQSQETVDRDWGGNWFHAMK